MECFIHRFHKSIGLWVIRRASLVNHGVMFSKIMNDHIQKMTSLIVDELDRATKTAPNMLIYEFGRGSRSVVS